MILKNLNNDTCLSDLQLDGWSEITQQEYADICEQKRVIPNAEPPTPLQSLQQLDIDNALTQRNLRETVMLMAEAFKTLSGGALDLSQIPGVQKVYAVEAEAAALRATP